MTHPLDFQFLRTPRVSLSLVLVGARVYPRLAHAEAQDDLPVQALDIEQADELAAPNQTRHAASRRVRESAQAKNP